MAKRIWQDRVVEKPRTFNINNNPDGTVTLVPAPGTIIQQGTPVNAANLNGLEEDLDAHEVDNMPHQFVDGSKTYKWGFRTVAGVPQFIYEEMI